MRFIKASEVRKNHLIVLDMGYGHNMNETCMVMNSEYVTNFFGIGVYRFKVRRPGGELINVVDHLPNDKVEVSNESS